MPAIGIRHITLPALACGSANVTPDFQNPTGDNLDLAQRTVSVDLAHKLLALEAQRAGGGIDKGRVIYCGTFSKTVVPALRLGRMVAQVAVIRKLVLIKCHQLLFVARTHSP